MKDSDRPQRRTGFLTQRLDDEVILYDPEQSRALCLNWTASIIWGLCDGAATVADMIELLREAFPDAGDIDRDVSEALELLSRHAAITKS
jgi:Coenzyme PQQ synthesis protein D (PqqD)